MWSKLACVGVVALGVAAVAEAGPASGAFKLQKGAAISPKHATGYVVREQRDAHKKRVEILLSEVPVDASGLHAALEPHMVAINLDELKDKNYVLLWVAPDGAVTMNATYGSTMTQFINDTSDGLKAVFTSNTPTKIEGRVTSPSALKSMDGTTYSVDLTFSVDVPPPPTGQALPAGGGDPGKALTALLAAATKKNWAAIKAASSPDMLKMFDRSYNTPAENAASALDLLKAWIPISKMKISAGELRGDSAILDVEGEMFPGMRGLSLVRMVKTGTTWQIDQAQRAGFVP